MKLFILSHLLAASVLSLSLSRLSSLPTFFVVDDDSFYGPLYFARTVTLGYHHKHPLQHVSHKGGEGQRRGRCQLNLPKKALVLCASKACMGKYCKEFHACNFD